MNRWLKRLLAVLLVPLLLLTAFFFWASAGTQEEQARLVRYEGVPVPAPPETLAVMSYNIGYLSGMTNNLPVVRERQLFERNLDAAATLIRRAGPDVIGFQEIDFRAARSFDRPQLDLLARRLGYGFGAAAVNWDVRYLPFPYSWNPSVHFGRTVSGQAILSRYPIVRHTRTELQRTTRPFYSDAFYLDRLAQIVQIDLGARLLSVVNVHLEAFEQATREAQAATVRRLVRRRAGDGPLLLMGDFNAPLPAARAQLPPEVRQRFAGDETLRLLLEGTTLQAARPTSNGGTYPADAPQVAIDHIFYTPGALDLLGARILCSPSPEAAPPSDHCAVVARFAFAGS